MNSDVEHSSRAITICMYSFGLPRWLSGKESTCQCRRLRFTPSIRKNPLEEEMATHTSIVAWEIPWTEVIGGLRSMVLQKSWTWLSYYTAATYLLLWSICVGHLSIFNMIILLFLVFSVIFIIWLQALYEMFFILLRVSFTEKKFLALV